MQVTATQLQALIDHARSTSDEACGVVLGQRQPLLIKQIVPARNVHPQPQHHFLVDAATLLHADDLARANDSQIIGFYHSHPRSAAVPSPADRHAAWPGYVYVIIGFAGTLPYICAWYMEC